MRNPQRADKSSQFKRWGSKKEIQVESYVASGGTLRLRTARLMRMTVSPQTLELGHPHPKS